MAGNDPLGHFRHNDPGVSLHNRVLCPSITPISCSPCSNTPFFRSFSITSGLVPSSPVSVNCPFRANVQNFKMRFLGSTSSELKNSFAQKHLRVPGHLFKALSIRSNKIYFIKITRKWKTCVFLKNYKIDPRFSLQYRLPRLLKHPSTCFICSISAILKGFWMVL